MCPCVATKCKSMAAAWTLVTQARTLVFEGKHSGASVPSCPKPPRFLGDSDSLARAVCRLIDLTTRHRQETEMETERLRSAQFQAERTLEARERAHRQRVKGLEEQVRPGVCVCVCVCVTVCVCGGGGLRGMHNREGAI